MPTADPDDDIGSLSLDDDAESSSLPDELEDDEGDRLRHASTGLLIVTFAMVTFVMSLAAMSLISLKYMGQPNQFQNPWMFGASAAFWISTLVSLIGKLKMGFDRESLAKPQYLDWSMLAGAAPYIVLGLRLFLPLPGEAFLFSMLGVPVSYLMFVRFLRTLAEQYDRCDLVRRADRLLNFSLGVVPTALFGFLFMLIVPGIGAAFVVASYLASLVPAFWYARLLVEMRRLV
jgi:hypothetical protein